MLESSLRYIYTKSPIPLAISDWWVISYLDIYIPLEMVWLLFKRKKKKDKIKKKNFMIPKPQKKQILKIYIF